MKSGDLDARRRLVLILYLLAPFVLSSCQRMASTPIVEAPSLHTRVSTPYHEGIPVSSPEQAVVAASFGVATTRLEALATPQAPVVEQLTHRSALDRVGHENDAENSAYPDELDVWLVVFEGEWSITPPMSTALPPFYGCVFAILDAAQGHAFHVGTCPCSICNPP